MNTLIAVDVSANYVHYNKQMITWYLQYISLDALTKSNKHNTTSIHRNLIMIYTMSCHNLTSIFKTKHISAAKFCMGYEKNMSFLLIPISLFFLSQKNWSRLLWIKKKWWLALRWAKIFALWISLTFSTKWWLVDDVIWIANWLDQSVPVIKLSQQVNISSNWL